MQRSRRSSQWRKGCRAPNYSRSHALRGNALFDALRRLKRRDAERRKAAFPRRAWERGSLAASGHSLLRRHFAGALLELAESIGIARRRDRRPAGVAAIARAALRINLRRAADVLRGIAHRIGVRLLQIVGFLLELGHI